MAGPTRAVPEVAVQATPAQADLSTIAKLSRVYTNHCLRATAATVLGHKGAIGREITAFTGHRHQHSLLPYIAGPSETRNKK